MKRLNTRLLVTAVALIIGLSQLTPWQDKPYDAYLLHEVKANREVFRSVLEEAQKQVAEKKASGLMQALIALCHEKHLDLSTCFTQFNIADIRNSDKRNRILLQHLFQRSRSVFKQGLDLKGGVAFSLHIHPQVLEKKTDEECRRMVQKAIEVISGRIDALGVSEPMVRPRGRGGIEVQLPGISLETNADIVSALKKPAKLEFRLVNEAVEEGGSIPAGYEKLFLEREDDKGETVLMPLIVKKIPEMTGKSVKEAHPVVDQYGKYEVSLQMTPSGKERFATVTRQNLHKSLAIVLDGKVCSAPVIQSEITGGQASISGHFTQREAIELSNVLNNPLEFELDLAEIYEIGPSLASGARDIAVKASIIGVCLLVAVMIGYYRLPGAVCGLALLLNFVFILVSWVLLNATITLPGITALALTLGMAVDANVLIFERMREEIKAGRGTEAALELGHRKAFLTILDSNITTLLTAVLLVVFGVGSVKGFGITLAVGVLTTLFTVLCFNRALLEILVQRGLFRLSPNAWFGEAHFDFLSHRKTAAVSIALFLIGCVALGIRGKNVLSVDFIGGEELLVRGDRQIDCQKVRQMAKDLRLGEVNAVYQKTIGTAVPLLKIQTEKGRGVPVLKALREADSEAHFECLSHNQMGASVSSDVQKNALLSVTFALLGILIYIALRFEFSYGIASVAALVHDTILTIGLYIAFGHQFTAPMVAAVLLVIGYSINDKIIIFDRVREELKTDAFSPLPQIVNTSVNKTLSRTLMTGMTTFIPALLLYLCCSGIVRDYALVFMLGICIGTFSSIFIAVPIFCKWNKGDRKRLDSKAEEVVPYESLKS